MRIVEKPWGRELIFAETERYAGKILVIHAGQRLSLQFHREKDESILVLDGVLDVQIGTASRLETLRLEARDALRIKPGVVHRMIAVTDVEVAEVSTPELSDVVRLEDDYGRAEPTVGETAVLVDV